MEAREKLQESENICIQEGLIRKFGSAVYRPCLGDNSCIRT